MPAAPEGVTVDELGVWLTRGQVDSTLAWKNGSQGLSIVSTGTSSSTANAADRMRAGLPRQFHTATPVANRANRRHSAALSELEPLFLNGQQRSVNRKVQGSNPCSGAKIQSQIDAWNSFASGLGVAIL
jgi:hypothetical protein